MMRTVSVRDVIIGEGAPKVCVPIVGTTQEEILQEARIAAASPADMAEFRADCYEDVLDHGKLEEILTGIRHILGDMPLLMTLRTQEEGGCIEVSDSEYSEINIRASRSGAVDLIDVELFRGDKAVSGIVESAHEAGVRAIASSHDFKRTPSGDEIINRLCRMQETGADIIKIAVMPQTRGDVIRLIAAADEMITRYADRPLIIISMGEEGVITRVAAEAFGSAVTFGCASRPSAPGQIGACELKETVTALHSILRAVNNTAN